MFVRYFDPMPEDETAPHDLLRHHIADVAERVFAGGREVRKLLPFPVFGNHIIVEVKEITGHRPKTPRDCRWFPLRNIG